MIAEDLFVFVNLINEYEMKVEIIPRTHCKKIETCEYIKYHNGLISANELLNYWNRICNQFPCLCELNIEKRI